VKQAGREMGVRHVLEGSARKAGNRVRVTAQSIEADTGNHIWAEGYDRDLTDVLTLPATLPPSSRHNAVFGS
jgi:TolB-like protein